MSSSGDRRRELIDCIYDAAFDDDAFSRLGAVIAEILDADQALAAARRGGAIVDMTLTGPRQWVDDYLAHYWRIDPWTPAILAAPHGRFAFGEELVPTSSISRSEFFVDFAKPQGVLLPLSGRVAVDAETDLLLSVNRLGDKVGFTDSEKRTMVETADHMRRMLQMRRKLEPSRASTLASTAADSLSFGIAVVKADGTLVYANAMLERIASARQGIAVSGGRLTTAGLSDAARLSGLIRQAGEARRSGGFSLSGDGVSASTSVIVTPAPRGDSFAPGVDAMALVAVAPPARTSRDARDILWDMFGLSDAEGDIVGALWAGATVHQVAERRGVKLTTLKSQLDAIYRKTGAANQRELARLLGALPQVRYPR